MRDECDALIEGFCRLVGLEDVEYVRRGGAIEVEGVVSSILYNERADPGLIFLYVDFGPPPVQEEAAALRELLKRNFMKFAGKGPSFTISPVSGHVVHVEHFCIEHTSPGQLDHALTSLSQEANGWRKRCGSFEAALAA